MMKSPTWVVAVGASAGGVEALSAFFSAVSPEIDAAFAVVLHIPPDSESHLHEILAKKTTLTVLAASDKLPLRAGHVYVAKADLHLTVDDDMVRLTRGPKECRARPAIDVLLRSVAVACGPRAVGIVLSGMLDDGTAGLWAVKQCQGLALVQDPADAMHASMPSIALQHVSVDFVGSAVALAAEVARIAQTKPVTASVSESTLHRAENLIATEPG